MPALDFDDRDRCRFHLGYLPGAPIPAGDAARLEEAMDTIGSSYQVEQIRNHLDRCDRAWEASEVIPNDYNDPNGSKLLNPSRLEVMSGDVERSVSVSEPLKADNIFREIYLREVDRLAETLYVANYRRPDVRSYAFYRSGSEYIAAVPGPADTAICGTIESFGFGVGWA